MLFKLYLLRRGIESLCDGHSKQESPEHNSAFNYEWNEKATLKNVCCIKHSCEIVSFTKMSTCTKYPFCIQVLHCKRELAHFGSSHLINILVSFKKSSLNLYVEMTIDFLFLGLYSQTSCKQAPLGPTKCPLRRGVCTWKVKSIVFDFACCWNHVSA